MGSRRFDRYQEPGLGRHKVGCWVRSCVDRILVNAGVANYSQARRNVLNIVHNVANSYGWINDEDVGKWKRMFTVPVSIVRTGGSSKLNVWIRGVVASGVDADKVRIRATVIGQGGSADTVELEFSNVGVDWEEGIISLSDDHDNQNDVLSFEIMCMSTGQAFDLYTISAYQEGDSSVAYTDLTGAQCVIADADYPDGAFARKLLRDNTVAVRNQKVMRSNVFNHWFQPSFKTGAAYGGDDGQLGRYKIVKRAGVETVTIHALAVKGGVGGNWTLKVTLNGDTDTALVNVAALTWYELTITMAGADITNELELELKLDGKEEGGGSANTQSLPYWCIVEDPPGAIAHSCADILDVMPAAGIASPIKASTWNNIKNSMNHLYQRGGFQLIGADWRPVGSNGGDYLHCDTVAFSKTHYLDDAAGMIARGLCFPSTSSKRIRIVLGYKTTTGSSHAKHLHAQISDDEAVFDTWDDVHPEYENNDHGAFQFTEEVVDQMRIFTCDLDIPAAEWEVHDPAGTPLQVFVYGATDHTDEYVIPDFCSVFEIELQEDEFPGA